MNMEFLYIQAIADVLVRCNQYDFALCVEES